MNSSSATSPPVTFEIIPTIKAAWHKIYGVKGTIWLAVTVLMLIAFVVGFILFGGIAALTYYFFPTAMFGIYILSNILARLLQYITQMGTLYLGILRARDETIHHKMAYQRVFKSDILWKLTGLWFVFLCLLFPAIFTSKIAKVEANLALFLISFLLIILTAYVFLRLALSSSFILDKQYNPLQAMNASIRATRGNVINILGIYLCMAFIILLCAIPLGIGLIWGFPFVIVCHGMIYQALLPNVT